MKQLLSFLSIIIVFSVLSCGSDGSNTDPQVETKGPISGTVNLFDSRGLAVLYENMDVTIVGTNFTTKTDANGFYNFPSVPFGDYTLEFAKEDFGTFLKKVEHNTGFSQNGTQLITLSLGKISETNIYETISSQENGDIKIRVVTTPVGTATSPVYVSIFFYTENSVSNTINVGAKGSIGFFSGNAGNIVTITAEELSDMGFNTGDQVFFKVYGDSYFTNEYEGENGEFIHPNVKQPGSSILSLTLN